jgi:hypothetical protein
MGFSKRRTIMINYAFHVKSSCISHCLAICMSKLASFEFSMQNQLILGLTCACIGPCMEDPTSHAHEFSTSLHQLHL